MLKYKDKIRLKPNVKLYDVYDRNVLKKISKKDVIDFTIKENQYEYGITSNNLFKFDNGYLYTVYFISNYNIHKAIICIEEYDDDWEHGSYYYFIIHKKDIDLTPMYCSIKNIPKHIPRIKLKKTWKNIKQTRRKNAKSKSRR